MFLLFWLDIDNACHHGYGRCYGEDQARDHKGYNK